MNKYELIVEDTSTENSDDSITRTITVLAETITGARSTYFEKCVYTWKILKSIMFVSKASPEEIAETKNLINFFACDPKLESKLYDHANVEVMSSIPVNSNPFQHDLSSMGTILVRDIIIMHPGYDSKENPQPLEWLYVVNTRTGNRVRVVFDSSF